MHQLKISSLLNLVIASASRSDRQISSSVCLHIIITALSILACSPVVGGTSSTTMSTLTTSSLCSDPSAQLLSNHLTYYYANQSLITSFPAPAGTSISIECALGYSDAGVTQQMVCQSTGSWSMPTCALISAYCNSSAAPQPSNSRSISTTAILSSVGQTTSFQCAIGYVGDATDGQPSLTCSAGTVSAGSWTSNNGSCEAIQYYCNPSTVPLANNSYASIINTTVNSTTTELCKAGYAPDPYAGAPQVTCRAFASYGGQWALGSGSCFLVANYCSPASAPQPSNTETTTLLRALGGVTELACTTGFVSSTGAQPTLACTQNSSSSGTWVVGGGTCVLNAAYCNVSSATSPSNILNGTTLNATLNATTVYSCALGYTPDPINGAPMLTCAQFNSSNGIWVEDGYCVAIANYCSSSLPSPANTQSLGPINSTVGASVSYVCSNGYQATIVPQTTCTALNASIGFWSLNSGNCTAIQVYCGIASIPSLGNGQATVTSTSIGSVATYRCATGYVSSAVSTVPNAVCSAFNATSGQWSLSSATCTLVDCGDPTSSLANYSATYSGATPGSTTYGTSYSLVCNAGLVWSQVGSNQDLTSARPITCNADGAWQFDSISVCIAPTTTTSINPGTVCWQSGACITIIVVGGILVLAVLCALLVVLAFLIHRLLHAATAPDSALSSMHIEASASQEETHSAPEEQQKRNTKQFISKTSERGNIGVMEEWQAHEWQT